MVDPTNVGHTFNLPDDRTYVAVRGFCAFLQHLFRNMDPTTGVRWDPNEELTGIHIFMGEPIEAIRTSAKPRISVERSPVSSVGVGLDSDLKTGGFMNPTGEKVSTEVYSTFISMTIVAQTDVMAGQLGWFIMRLLPIMRRQICRVAQLHKLGQNVQMSTVTRYSGVIPGSPSQEWRQLTLTVSASLQDNVSLKDGYVFNLIRSVDISLKDA